MMTACRHQLAQTMGWWCTTLLSAVCAAWRCHGKATSRRTSPPGCWRALGATSSLVGAIALHNILAGMAVVWPMYTATGSEWQAMKWCIVDSMWEPFAIMFGAFFNTYLTHVLTATQNARGEWRGCHCRCGMVLVSVRQRFGACALTVSVSTHWPAS